MILTEAVGVEGVTYGVLFAKTLVIMIAIIALAFLSIKYLMPKLVRMRHKGSQTIEILDFQAIEQRKAIYVVRIEDKKMALGVTDHNITRLCEWEDFSVKEES